MTDFLRNIPETLKGILLMTFGATLLCHTFGLLTKQLDLIIIVAAIIMLIYGFVILNGPKRMADLLNKEPQKEDPSKHNFF